MMKGRSMTPARLAKFRANREASHANLIARLEAAVREHEAAGDADRAAWYRELLDEVRGR